MSSFYTAEKERGIVERPLPIKKESRSLWVTPGHQRLLSIPGHKHLLVYTRAPTSAMWIMSSASSCLYQVIDNSSFIPGHQQFPCLYQVINDSLFMPGEKRAIHTSGRGVVSASSAGKPQTSGFWAVCMCGAWESTIHASGMILGSEYPPDVHSLRCPKQWEAVQHG